MSARKHWPTPAEIVAVYHVFGDEGVFTKWPTIERSWLTGQLARGLSQIVNIWRGTTQ